MYFNQLRIRIAISFFRCNFITWAGLWTWLSWNNEKCFHKSQKELMSIFGIFVHEPIRFVTLLTNQNRIFSVADVQEVQKPKVNGWLFSPHITVPLVFCHIFILPTFRTFYLHLIYVSPWLFGSKICIHFLFPHF